MIKFKDILLESPESVYIEDENRSVEWTNKDAIPFGMLNGKMFIGIDRTENIIDDYSAGDTHGEIHINPKYGNYFKNRNLHFLSRESYDYSGRLWKNSKIITFWEYPKPNEMKHIINLLEKETGLSIWNTQWRIEVIINNNVINYGDVGNMKFGFDEDIITELIPITDYVGSEEQIGKEMNHVISPLKKKQKIVPIGIGSEKDTSDIHARTIFYTKKGLGDGVVKLKSIFKKLVEFNYRGHHTAPNKEYGVTLDQAGNGDMYPKDIYSDKGYKIYGDGFPFDKLAWQVICQYRNKPDAKLKIYRAIPKDINDTINVGDWVTITKEYAINHGESELNNNFKIITKIVKAKDIWTNADSMHEWGYDPS